MPKADMSFAHVPVLATELIELLALKPGETVVDCTFGGGGHARLVAEQIGPSGTLIAVDRDPVAASRFKELAAELPCKTRFVAGSFSAALTQLVEEDLGVDVVYFDLGVSSPQIDTKERGFSYSYDAPLDMRMDPNQTLTAREILNGWEERRVARLLREYGEERYAARISRAVVAHRAERPFESTQELVEVVKAAIPGPARFAAGHPAKRVFQALRIAVNDELGELERALPLAWELLSLGGRLAAISFHSLEDRRVKRFLAERAKGCVCPPDLPICVCGRSSTAELLTRKVVVPSEAEIEKNLRAKPARLRVARKLRPESGVSR